MTTITPELEKLFKLDTFFIASNNCNVSLMDYMIRRHGWTAFEYYKYKKLYGDSLLDSMLNVDNTKNTEPKRFYQIFVHRVTVTGHLTFEPYPTHIHNEPNNWWNTYEEARNFITEHFNDIQPEGAEEVQIGVKRTLVILPVFTVVSKDPSKVDLVQE